ncbi:vomeronasal type-1 receptor 4-like [Perognathus longimembris pacificus]|uniref:vomeronasal type-1 receptor 4-like n=1 Tax=Perognathus longimembris pacificus TaxID=214514 RepID=UPI00201A1D24|nr:vomeronasal type-1 receptor 4-like [Perognathus longimembris pacificus]
MLWMRDTWNGKDWRCLCYCGSDLLIPDCCWNSGGIPQTMLAWGWRDFLSDLGCKLVSYVYRVGKGVVIGSTCFLSIFQAVSISPGASRWAGLKGRAHKHIVSMVYLSWGVSLLMNAAFLMYITGPKIHDNVTTLKAHGYCSPMRHNPAAAVLYVALLSVPDVLCLGLMLWASISMLFILYTHKQRMKHIQRTSVSCRASPESRAAKSILLLASTFVSFYTLSCICQICLSVTYNPSPVLLLNHGYMCWLMDGAAAMKGFPPPPPFFNYSSERCSNPPIQGTLNLHCLHQQDCLHIRVFSGASVVLSSP